MDARHQIVVDRFYADEAFRHRVLEDANGAVKQEFGIDLPGPVRVVSEGDGYRIEPVVGPDSDLSDEQLELVAGGKGGSPTCQPRISSGAGIISNNCANVIGQNGASLIGKAR